MRKRKPRSPYKSIRDSELILPDPPRSDNAGPLIVRRFGRPAGSIPASHIQFVQPAGEAPRIEDQADLELLEARHRETLALNKITARAEAIGAMLTEAAFKLAEKETPAKTQLRGFTGLGQKKQDLSGYFINLTHRQKDCISLRFEYGLTESEVSRRLCITRATVQEHLRAGARKIKQKF
jgi:hypothetical protein